MMSGYRCPDDGPPTLENAYANLTALLEAAGRADAPWRRDVDAVEENGLFEFWVTLGEEEISVSVPGASLSKVKGNQPHAPRFFIDGNSWWWQFAIQSLKDWAPNEEDHCEEYRKEALARRRKKDS